MNQLPLINLCVHPGCGIPAINKYKSGYCWKHYHRVKMHGCADTVKIGGHILTQGDYCPLYIARRRKADYWGTKVEGKNLLVHRLIASIILGRPLDTNEQVHHKDGNGLNNSLDNLEIMSASDHSVLSNKRRNGEEPF